MLSLEGRLTLRDLFEQAWKQVEQSVLEQFQRTIEGLLGAERDRRVAEARQRGEKVYRWGYRCASVGRRCGARCIRFACRGCGERARRRSGC